MLEYTAKCYKSVYQQLADENKKSLSGDCNRQSSFFFFFFFLKIFLIVSESGRKGEREGEKHQCMVAYWAPGLQPRHVP